MCQSLSSSRPCVYLPDSVTVKNGNCFRVKSAKTGSSLNRTTNHALTRGRESAYTIRNGAEVVCVKNFPIGGRLEVLLH